MRRWIVALLVLVGFAASIDYATRVDAHGLARGHTGTVGPVAPVGPTVVPGSFAPGTCTSQTTGCLASLNTNATGQPQSTYYYQNNWYPQRQPVRQGSSGSPYYNSDVMAMWEGAQLQTITTTKQECIIGGSQSGVPGGKLDYGIDHVNFYADGSDTRSNASVTWSGTDEVVTITSTPAITFTTGQSVEIANVVSSALPYQLNFAGSVTTGGSNSFHVTNSLLTGSGTATLAGTTRSDSIGAVTVTMPQGDPTIYPITSVTGDGVVSTATMTVPWTFATPLVDVNRINQAIVTNTGIVANAVAGTKVVTFTGSQIYPIGAQVVINSTNPTTLETAAGTFETVTASAAGTFTVHTTVTATATGTAAGNTTVPGVSWNANVETVTFVPPQASPAPALPAGTMVDIVNSDTNLNITHAIVLSGSTPGTFSVNNPNSALSGVGWGGLVGNTLTNEGYGYNISVSGYSGAAAGLNGANQIYASLPATHSQDTATVSFLSSFSGTATTGSLSVTDPLYWCVNIDPSQFADGFHEMRAVVYPKAGWPRLMQSQHFIERDGATTHYDHTSGANTFFVPANGYSGEQVTVDSVANPGGNACLFTSGSTGTTSAQGYQIATQVSPNTSVQAQPSSPLRGYQLALYNTTTGVNAVVPLNGCTDDGIVLNNFRGGAGLRVFSPFGGVGQNIPGLRNNQSFWFTTNFHNNIWMPKIYISTTNGVDQPGCGASQSPLSAQCATTDGAVLNDHTLNPNSASNASPNVNYCVYIADGGAGSGSTAFSTSASGAAGACDVTVGTMYWTQPKLGHENGIMIDTPYYVEGINGETAGTRISAGNTFIFSSTPIGSQSSLPACGVIPTVICWTSATPVSSGNIMQAAGDGATLVLEGTRSSPEYYNLGQQPQTTFSANFFQWLTITGTDKRGAIINTSGSANANMGIGYVWLHLDTLSICGIDPTVNVSSICDKNEPNPYGNFQMGNSSSGASDGLTRGGFWGNNLYIVGPGAYITVQSHGITTSNGDCHVAGCSANNYGWQSGMWFTNSEEWNVASLGPLPNFAQAISSIENVLLSGSQGQLANTTLLINTTYDGLVPQSFFANGCALYNAGGNPGTVCNSDNTLTSQTIVPIAAINPQVVPVATPYTTSQVPSMWGSSTRTITNVTWATVGSTTTETVTFSPPLVQSITPGSLVTVSGVVSSGFPTQLNFTNGSVGDAPVLTPLPSVNGNNAQFTFVNSSLSGNCSSACTTSLGTATSLVFGSYETRFGWGAGNHSLGSPAVSPWKGLPAGAYPSGSNLPTSGNPLIEACYDATGASPNCLAGQAIFANCQAATSTGHPNGVSCVQMAVAESITQPQAPLVVGTTNHVDAIFIKEGGTYSGNNTFNDWVLINFGIPNLLCDVTSPMPSCNSSEGIIGVDGQTSDFFIADTNLGQIDSRGASFHLGQIIENWYSKNNNIGIFSGTGTLGGANAFRVPGFYGGFLQPPDGGQFGDGTNDPVVFDNNVCTFTTELNNNGQVSIPVYASHWFRQWSGNGTVATGVFAEPGITIPLGSSSPGVGDNVSTLSYGANHNLNTTGQFNIFNPVWSLTSSIAPSGGSATVTFTTAASPPGLLPATPAPTYPADGQHYIAFNGVTMTYTPTSASWDGTAHTVTVNFTPADTIDAGAGQGATVAPTGFSCTGCGGSPNANQAGVVTASSPGSVTYSNATLTAGSGAMTLTSATLKQTTRGYNSPFLITASGPDSVTFAVPSTLSLTGTGGTLSPGTVQTITHMSWLTNGVMTFQSAPQGMILMNSQNLVRIAGVHAGAIDVSGLWPANATATISGTFSVTNPALVGSSGTGTLSSPTYFGGITNNGNAMSGGYNDYNGYPLTQLYNGPGELQFSSTTIMPELDTVQSIELLGYPATNVLGNPATGMAIVPIPSEDQLSLPNPPSFDACQE